MRKIDNPRNKDTKAPIRRVYHLGDSFCGGMLLKMPITMVQEILSTVLKPWLMSALKSSALSYELILLEMNCTTATKPISCSVFSHSIKAFTAATRPMHAAKIAPGGGLASSRIASVS
eukprot:TRINITY_DN1525_c0_g1_i3.p1 TRINITY_DN1525_c0_g1~~TRINITY_DN1525_c0_g1_i3.p1  ORF type:complete len:118 (-),score=17.00 TRINITY_DN1525_c0_g1_i3:222-575(-)